MILNGVKLANEILEDLAEKPKLKKLTLAVIQAGDNQVSLKYIEEKKKAAKELGIEFSLMWYPATVSQATLIKEMRKLGKDKKVFGMIVQLPLPKHLNTQFILDEIPQRKDIDVLSSASFAKFALGIFPVLPPTVAAISLLLKQTKKRLEGTQVAVVGAGRLVGLPVSVWLAQQGTIVSLIQKGTENASQLIKKADIVISGVGKAGLITGTMIKKGAVVIDAGTSAESGKTQGDVDFKSVSKKAKFLSPVPGGVGPLTVACLLKNLYILASI